MTTKEQTIRHQKVIMSIYPLAWVYPEKLAASTGMPIEEITAELESMHADGLMYRELVGASERFKLTQLGRLTRRVTRRILEPRIR
jgi:hypothetical protein